MDTKTKQKSLTEKMNSLTEKFNDSIGNAEEIDNMGDDLIELAQEKIQAVEISTNNIPITEIINLKNMVDDFKFVRETLKNNTKNGRRVLDSITFDLLDFEKNSKDNHASLIMSFAELNKAVADNMKLYVNSYKEISNILLNLHKIRSGKDPLKNNEKTINPKELISTADLIDEMNNKKQ
jgi:hypothetical protein